jgi:biopolymer transport protein TolQ
MIAREELRLPTSDALGSNVLDLVLQAGPVAKAVLALLGVFSIVSWALIVDKWWQLRRVRSQTIEFLRSYREGRRPSVVLAAAKKLRESPLAQLYVSAHQEVSGISEMAEHVIDDNEDGLSGDRLDAVHRAMRRTTALEIARLERYLPFLATTASATPFIGLFGTVWGIMGSFHGIGQQGSANLAVVAPGISEALIATAFGLAAAIPAVIAYNYFLNRVKHWATEMEGFTMDLLNLVARPVPKLTRRAKDGV